MEERTAADALAAVIRRSCSGNELFLLDFPFYPLPLLHNFRVNPKCVGGGAGCGIRRPGEHVEPR